MTRIKICGITNLDEALAACEAGADAVGFVFAESLRRVSAETVAAIVPKLPAFVTTVGVFVNQSADEVRDIARKCALHLVQMHGDEDRAFCRGLGLPYVKAFRASSPKVTKEIVQFGDTTFVLDSYVAGKAGGTGVEADWGVASEAAQSGKMILAGGLTAENVREALERVRPYAVDVSSGVESRPGEKDTTKIKQFIREVRTWDYLTNGVISADTAAGLYPKR